MIGGMTRRNSRLQRSKKTGRGAAHEGAEGFVRLRPLARCEWRVMQALWAGGEMRMGDIRDALGPGRPWTSSTLKMLVRRLVRKKWISRRPIGRRYIYSATTPYETTAETAMQDFFDRVLGRQLERFLAYLRRTGQLSRA